MKLENAYGQCYEQAASMAYGWYQIWCFNMDELTEGNIFAQELLQACIEP